MLTLFLTESSASYSLKPKKPKNINFNAYFIRNFQCLFRTESSGSNSLKPKKPKNIYFNAKILTTFDPFGSALIGAPVTSISDILCLVFDDTFGLLLCGVFLAGWLLPHRPGAAPPRSVTAILAPLCSVPFIAPIILLALIFAELGGGGLILARRLQSRLDISADSSSLGAYGPLLP